MTLDKRSEKVRLAAQLAHGGKTYREVAEEIGVAASTVFRWSKHPEWLDEWQVLDNQVRERRRELLDEELDLVMDTSKGLGRFSFENIEGALKVQRKVLDRIDSIEIPEKIVGVEGVLDAVKILSELTKMVNISFEGFQLAMDLQSFLQENQAAPEIIFEDYTEAEIQAIANAQKA